MRVTVESYSGYRAHERPVRFSLDGTPREIREVVDRWYGPEYLYFKVRADDGGTYILRYDERGDAWDLSFYERGGLRREWTGS
ncbi:MAG: hypothetical protein JXA20_17775 [Spirochaetes bacterium]|nr:hypothetical protein [Spirochaetota bacterium]